MTKTNRRTMTMIATAHLQAITGGGSRYNQAETLASSVQKKESDTEGQIINKI